MYKNKLISKKEEKKQKEKNYNEKKQDDSYENQWNEDSVTHEDNHIYFYADVNTKNILQLNKCINELNNKFLSMKSDLNIKYNSEVAIPIYLHINSNGGYITDALAGVDKIKNSKIPIISIVEGYAASAATLLSIVAKKRQITENSSMLIHQLSGGMWGTYQQMIDDFQNCTYLENLTSKIYLNYSKGKLKKKKLKKYLKRDLMWDAKKCKELGLIDEII